MADFTANPFDKLLNPDNGGTILGTLGAALGVQSPRERAGAATGEALKDLATLRDQGLSPQQAIVKFLQSPRGTEMFVADPNLAQTLQNFIQQTTPPNPQLTTLSEGQQLASTTPAGQPGGGTTTLAAKNPSKPQLTNVPPGNALFQTNPDTGATSQVGKVAPADVQSFNDLQQIAQADPKRVREIAEARLLPTPMQQSLAAERAVRQLVKDGSVSPEVGNKIIGGVYKIQPIKNMTGDDTGQFVIIDTATQNVVPLKYQINPDGSTTTNPSYQPGEMRNKGRPGEVITIPQGGQLQQQPGAGQAGPEPKPQIDIDLQKDKRTMFLGTGALPGIVSYMGHVGRNIDPSLTSPQSEAASARRDYIEQLHASLIALRDNQAGLGIPAKVIDTALGLAPGFGPLEDATAATRKGIQLYDLSQAEIDRDRMQTQDVNLPREQRVAASRRMSSWDRVQKALPSRDEMVQLYGAIKQNKAGAVDIPTAGGAVWDITMGGTNRVMEGLTKTMENISGTGKPGANGQSQQQQQQAPAKFDESKIPALDEASIVKINPATLTPQGRVLLQQRVQQLIQAKRGAK